MAEFINAELEALQNSLDNVDRVAALTEALQEALAFGYDPVLTEKTLREVEAHLEGE